MFGIQSQKRIYLDYAAATPVSNDVLAAMRPYWQRTFANPSAIHQEGVAARRAVEQSRQDLARTLGVRTEDVLFTGSGTESNNLAIAGTIESRRREGVSYSEMEVVTTAIEHPSVTNVLANYQERGVIVRHLPLDETGTVIVSEVENCLTSRTVLVVVGYVNSEVGTIEPVKAITRAVRAREKLLGTTISVHVDAAQAPLWLPCQLSMLGVDTLALDAGKCYGPKGVGVLALRHGARLAPVSFGGGQEAGLRPGTENTPLIVGAAVAITRAQREWQRESERVSELRDELIAACQAIPDVVVNGSLSERVANNVNISVSGVEAEFAVISLDRAGFAISTKSACSGADGAGSVVVRTITGDTERSKTTLRITLGRETTLLEVQRFVSALTAHITTTRAAQSTLTHK